MNILIVGGTRFLGYHLARRLLAEGHAVALFNRGKTPDDFGDRVERIGGDRYDKREFRERLAGHPFDAVVDMIAYTADDSRSAVEIFRGNVGHYIHIGSAAVYLVTKDYLSPLREEDYDRPLAPRPRGDAGMWDYGIGKRGCEDILRAAHARDGFPVTIVRPPIIVGERDYTLRAYSYFLRLRDGKPLVLPDGGQSVFSLVYQNDIVRAIASNLGNTRSFGKAYNLAQRRALSLKEFLERAALTIGVSPEFISIPYAVLKKVGWRPSSSPFFNRRPLVLDTRMAEIELGFTSTPIDTWIDRTVRWFADEYRSGPPDNYRSRDDEVRIVRDYQKAIQGRFG
jgi:nucleoside-diphosphate-sugar epimerase